MTSLPRKSSKGEGRLIFSQRLLSRSMSQMEALLAVRREAERLRVDVTRLKEELVASVAVRQEVERLRSEADDF